MTSLTGKSYKMEGERKIVLLANDTSSKTPKVQAFVKSRDSFFVSENKSFKRLVITNCLDQRYYEEDSNTDRG